MPKWYEFTVHGQQTFGSNDEIGQRAGELSQALDELLSEIVQVCSSDGLALTKAVALRGRTPVKGEAKSFIPSRYEGLNQLIHYSYCLIAARRLAIAGCTNIQVIPCGRDARKGPDVSAVTPTGVRVSGEVFCVSASLRPAKMANARKALMLRSSPIKFILFNAEALAGGTYRPKTTEVAYFAHNSADQNVSLVAYRRADGQSDAAPLDISGNAGDLSTRVV